MFLILTVRPLNIPIHCYFIGAIIQISKNLACEWARDGIRTNSVAPWAVNTGVKVESVNIHPLST